MSPAGPISRESLDAGVDAFARLGIPVALDREAVLARDAYLAGDDRARASALLAALDLEPAGLWMSRGGYGSLRTLAALGDALREAPPSPLWAFSDGTALAAAWVALGWPAWLAPPASQLPRLDPESLARVRAATLAGEIAPFEGLTPLTLGHARGPLAGGNLCVLASLIGTPWAAQLSGAVVVLEDVGEPAYKVDRLLTQLALAGALDGIRALVFGDFTGVPDGERAAIYSLLDRFAETLDVPCARGLPVGHGPRNAPLPLGLASGYLAQLEVSPAGARLSVEPAR